MGDWEGTVELTGTVTVPPLSARVARYRVIRRDDPMLVKVPRNQEVLVDPDGLPDVYMARVVATLQDNLSSSNVGDSPSYVVNLEKSLLVKSVFSPQGKFVASSDGSVDVTADVTSSNGKTGSGEYLPKLPESGLPVVTTSHWDDLQTEDCSRPVPAENRISTQVDTNNKKKAQNIGRFRIKSQNEVMQRNQRTQKRIQILGYVPIQIANLSLEEVELKNQTYVGIASHIKGNERPIFGGFDVNPVLRDVEVAPGKFEEYIQEKLPHLRKEEQKVLGTGLRQYKHLFYGLGSTKLGCTSQMEHSIDTGDARPIKRNPYRIPYALKPVVDEHIEMLEKEIIEPSMSPWSSSIVLVQKKSRDGSIKYRFCIDYRALNAVTKLDAYPIPNIVDTLDSLEQSKIFSAVDMASGYHQIAVKTEHREKTAFSCHRGHFQYIKMPFVLNNAPATYQRCIDVVLMGLKGIYCLVYLDDIVCFSATMEEHARKLYYF